MYLAMQMTSLTVGYDSDGRDCDRTVKQVMQICHQENLKGHKNKCHFGCTRVPFFGKIVSVCVVQLDPKNCACLPICHPLITRMNSISFLGIMNYLGKFSPSITEACEPLRKLTSRKAEWACNKKVPEYS